MSYTHSKTGKPLAGATFRVARIEDGAHCLDRVTGVDGKIVINGLEPGVYSAQELAAPGGYVRDETEYHVELFPGRTSTLVVSNAHKPDLKIVKRDADTGVLLAGASFTVRKADSATYATVTTDAEGESWLYGLEPGVYEITETLPPPGYLPNTTPQLITLFPNRAGVAEFTNHKKPGLIILKVDETTGLPLKNAEFSVKHKDGGIVWEGLTDERGEIRLSDLDADWYTITELAAPYGYLKRDESKDVKFDPGKTLQVKFDNRLRPALKIIKVDEQTKRPLAGAKFRLWKSEDDTTSEYITGEDGTVMIYNLDEAIYSVEEISAPQGYLLDPQHRDIELEWGKVKELVFTNKEKPALVILKIDAVTTKPLPGAEFSIRHKDGALVWEGLTDEYGEIRLHDLDADWYTITEILPPSGHIADTAPKDVKFEPDKTLQVKFDNTRKPVLVFLKTNALTGAPVPGATFRVEYEQPDGGVQNLGSFKTGADGRIVVPKAEPGWYVLTETLPAQGFSLPKNPVTRMYVGAGQNAYLPEFEGYYTSGGANAGSGGTDSYGVADGSVAEQPDSVSPSASLSAMSAQEHSGNEYFTQGEGFNWPLNSVVIKKTHAITGELLPDASFELYRADEQVSGVPGTMIGRYTTDSSGVIVITGLEAGYYVVKEAQAPPNFLISENSQQNGYLKSDGTSVLEFTFANYPYGSLLIAKTDAKTGLPLANAKFKATDSSGAAVGSSNGEFTTDSRGEVLIPNLKPGAYVITEISAPEGYALTAAPKTITIGTDGKTYTASFSNEPLGGLVIRKLDSATKEPLPGAQFKVTNTDGSAVGTSNGLFTTDADGVIAIPNLPKGGCVVTETKAPDGYVLENKTQTVSVEYGKTHTLDVYNGKLSGVQIIKIDSVTRQPIAGVLFEVSHMDGGRVGEFTTGADGTIFIPELESGWYTVAETKAAAGYILDAEPRNVEITWGDPVTLTVENTPQSGLLIVKTDAATGKPLAGVVFDVARADGQRVSGSILDGNRPNTEANSPNKTTSSNGDISGSHTTDANGRILINALPAGEYHVTERKTLDGYELDTEVHAVTVTPGKLAALQVTNRQKAGIRLLKIDSVTKRGIYGAEFMLFDASGAVVGNYTTDNNGVIDFSGILSEGRYTLRETRPATGYYRDDVPRTVEFKSGKVTEVVWENTPQMGQIQITKLSGDDNEQNGLPKGSPLANAIFEVYEHKSGNLADRIVSGADGRAVSKPLPLGRYTVREVQAPPWYMPSTDALDIEIEFATQIIKREFLNYSANTGVTIRKTGNHETMPGDEIYYTIKEVGNDSTVPLTDFYWRDTLPTDAVRLQKIVTGTYSQSLKYKILATTNKGDTRVIADSLSTTRNNVIDCGDAALGLANDEYVTSFSLLFGTVKAGFCQVEQPRVYVRVLTALPNGYEFANKADCGGKYAASGEWIAGNSVWRTAVYAPPKKLPRTGY